MEAKQTPLIELLERVPQDARVVIEHDQFSSSSHPVGRLCHEAAAALRAALAEPGSDYERGFVDGMSEQAKRSVDKAVNRMAQTTHWEGCEAVHPECKAKAITADEMSAWVKDTWEKCQAEAWQEPVTCMCREPWALGRVHREKTPCFDYVERKPLTDEEMRECAQAMNAEPLAEGWPELIKFARAIERAHGIGEQHDQR